MTSSFAKTLVHETESWPTLASAIEAPSSPETLAPNPQRSSPVPSQLDDGSVSGDSGKRSKWSKLPVQIRYSNPPSTKGDSKSSLASSSTRSASKASRKSPTDHANASANARQGHRKSKNSSPRPRSSSVVSAHHGSASGDLESNPNRIGFSTRKHGSSSAHGTPHPSTYRRDNVPMSRSAAKSYQGRFEASAPAYAGNSGNPSYFYSYYQPYPMTDFAFSPLPAESSLEMVQYWIRGQVEYYYSVENLCRDMYFRNQMNPSHGGVPLSVIAGFNRVKSLLEHARPFCPTPTEDLDETQKASVMEEWLRSVLVNSINTSNLIHVAEHDGLFVGLSQGWEYWILPAATQTEFSGNEQEEPFEGHKASSVRPAHLSVSIPTESADFLMTPPGTPLARKELGLVKSESASSLATLTEENPEENVTDAHLDSIVFILAAPGSKPLTAAQKKDLNDELVRMETVNGSVKRSCLDRLSRVVASGTSRLLGWYMAASQVTSSALLERLGFAQVGYRNYYTYAMNGIVFWVTKLIYMIDRLNPEAMAPLYVFWGHMLQSHFQKTWYSQFRDAVLEDARRGVYTGLESIKGIYVNGETKGLSQDWERVQALERLSMS